MRLLSVLSPTECVSDLGILHLFTFVHNDALPISLSPTPWSGIYCSTKAALHSITEVLQMECRPLGVSVVLLAPGSVKSNISDNHAKIFDLPPTSLYRSFSEQITRRMYTSHGPKSMPTSEFAKKAVTGILNKSGPPRYMVLGGYTLQAKIVQWLPRGLALWLLWRAFSK